MSVPRPHFLLYSSTGDQQQPRRWNFVLKRADGKPVVKAADEEPQTEGERLELLAVVRGLEALDQPSRVTLVTDSKYVQRGITFGLEDWRSNDWTWESFGEMVPVKNRDLWQRLDRAMSFHRLDLRTWRVDSAHHSIGDDAPLDPRPAVTIKTRRAAAAEVAADEVDSIAEAPSNPVAHTRMRRSRRSGNRLVGWFRNSSPLQGASFVAS